MWIHHSDVLRRQTRRKSCYFPQAGSKNFLATGQSRPLDRRHSQQPDHRISLTFDGRTVDSSQHDPLRFECNHINKHRSPISNPCRSFTHIGRRDGIVADRTSRRTEDDDASVRGVLDVVVLDQRVCAREGHLLIDGQSQFELAPFTA